MHLNKTLARAGISGIVTFILILGINRLFNPDIVILLPIAGLIGLVSGVLAGWLA